MVPIDDLRRWIDDLDSCAARPSANRREAQTGCGKSAGSRNAVYRSASERSPMPAGRRPSQRCAHASALRRHPGSALPDRQRRDHRGELRRLALLRAAAPAISVVPRVVLSVHRQRVLQRPRALGDQLADGDVHARKLGPHPREHAVPRRLREERGGRVRPPPLPRSSTSPAASSATARRPR